MFKIKTHLRHVAFGGLALGLSAFVTSALAHSPYLKPTRFSLETARKSVLVEASFAEGDLHPDVAMTSDRFMVVTPKGEVRPITPVVVLKEAAFLDVPLDQTGTYLISSGLRTGRRAKAALLGEKIRFLEDETALKPGERLIEVQSLTRADLFVSRGAPKGLEHVGEGVEIHPITAPYDAYAGEVITLMVREAGQPVPGAQVSVYPDGQDYRRKKRKELNLTSNAQGQVSFAPPEAGLYLIQTRIRRPSSERADLWLSYTATLTLEVLPK